MLLRARSIYMRARVQARGGGRSPWLWSTGGGCVSAGEEIVRKAREEKRREERRGGGGDRFEREPGGGAGGRSREDAVGWTQEQRS